MIKGSFSEYCFPTVLITLLKLKKTGRLTIHQKNSGYSLYFQEGKLKYITHLWGKEGLGRILIEKKLITEEMLGSFVKQESKSPLEQQLFQQKILPEQQLVEAMVLNSTATLRILDFLVEGDFVYIDGKAPFPLPTKAISIISYIISKTRQLNDLDKVFPLLEPLEAIPELDQEAPGFQTLLKIKLNAQEGFILSRIDGYNDFNRIFAFCGKDRLETARFMLLMLLLDIIKYNKFDEYISGIIQNQFAQLLALLKGAKNLSGRQRSQQHAGGSADESSDDAFADAVNEVDEKVLAEIKNSLGAYRSYNYYQMLQLKQSAAKQQIKKNYFQLAKKFHPDNFYRKLPQSEIDQVEELFGYIKKAYDVLVNDETRMSYDASMRAGTTSVVDADDAEGQKRMSAEYQYKQALIAMKQKDYGRAIHFLKAAHEFDPDNPLVLAKYAEAEFWIGNNLSTAEKMVKKALELRQKDGLLHLLYARILMRRKRIREAERQTNKALMYEPDHPEVRKMFLAIKKEKQKTSELNKKGFLGKIFGS